MKIGSREVGPGHPAFIIAECGSNHDGSLEAALVLIDAAADAGADAAKFQYFRVDRFLVARKDPASLRKYELPDEWLPILKARCADRHIEFLCTAFDLQSLAVVDRFVNAHKVGSYEAAKGDYCIDVMNRGKPMLISHGCLNGQLGYGRDCISLRCVSEYPAPVDGYLRGQRWVSPWGISDHTTDPFTVPCAAVALGACVVEKHMTMVHFTETPDSIVSIDEYQFRAMARAVRLTETAVHG